jgi:hypothetical protein
MERKIDCMKYRKSTHLAGVDVEMIVSTEGKCILTIKDAFYDTEVDVSGNKTDGYFLSFMEDQKDMVVNSGNRSRIALMLKQKSNCTPLASRNIGNWIGMKIELTYDPNIKMMGQVVGGIVVSSKAPDFKKPKLTDKHIKWPEVKERIRTGVKIEAIRKYYEITDELFKTVK